MTIFGNDYPTKDSTCIRDYIHMTDISQGHIFALNLFEKKNEKLFNDNYVIYNIDSNKGFSVKEVNETYEKVNNIKLNYKYRERRKGVATIALPDCTKIKKELGWSAKIGLEQMYKDSYNNLLLKNNIAS